jgi:hypothetical protein
VALMCALALAAPAGCGKASDAQLISSMLRSYLRAQAFGDGVTACPLLTVAARRQLVALVVKASGGRVASGLSCENAFVLIQAVADAKVLQALEHARVERVRVTGGRATAAVVDGSQLRPQQVSLEKVGGSWKIAGAPGLGG